MKNSKSILLYCIIMCLISLIICIILQIHLYPKRILSKYLQDTNNIKILLLNISYGIFTSAFVTALVTLREYKNNKNIWLIRYFDVLCQYYNLFINLVILDENLENYKFIDKNLKDVPNRYYKKGNLLFLEKIENINKEEKYVNKIKECKKFYIDKYNYMINNHLKQKLNECIDNIDFFNKKYTKEILSIYGYIHEIESTLTCINKHNFKYGINFEIKGIIDMQNMLIEKEIQQNYLIYYNKFSINMDEILDRLRYLNYKKVDEKYAKNKEEYIIQTSINIG